MATVMAPSDFDRAEAKLGGREVRQLQFCFFFLLFSSAAVILA